MNNRSTQSPVRRLTLVGLALLALGCGKKGAPDRDTAKADTLPSLVGAENLFVSETRELVDGPVVSGSLTPARSATIRAEIEGIVLAVLAEQGQPVRQGQLLARLNDDAVQDAVYSARAGVRTAETTLGLAKRNAERAERLAKAGAASEHDLEQARLAVTSAEGGLADAKARQASLEKQLRHTQVRAPINGVLSAKTVNAGDNVSNGTALFTVVDPTSLRLEAQVPVSALTAIKVGTPVHFSIEGVDDRTFEGKVIRINPAVDPATRQVQITVSVPNRTGTLVAGLFAQGQAALKSHKGVVIPTAAIDQQGVRPMVSKIEKGVVRRVEVTLGITDPTRDEVEILSGLAAGDTVIVGSARSLPPGTKIRTALGVERAAGGTTN